MRMPVFAILAGILLLGCCCDPDLRERSPYGSIEGYVQDSFSGERLPGATIRLSGTGIGALTDIDGYYRIKKIPTGRYTVEFSSVDYKRLTVDSVVIHPGVTTGLDVSLVKSPQDPNKIIRVQPIPR